MPYLQAASAVIASALVARASSSLSDICTVSNIQNALPANGTLLGIDLLPDSVTASVANSSDSSSGMGAMRKRQGPSSDSTGTSYEYCNVSLSFTHTGKGDTVNLFYGFPSPDDYQNRFYLAGGGGFALSTSAIGGLEYGAVSGYTDAGYNGAVTNYDEVALYGNGTLNWDNTYAFAYQALGELTQVGKYITPKVYGSSDDQKLYTYFSGCSDGGRQAMSQVQRFGEMYDGVVAGAPAFRFAQQQVVHLFPSVIEQTMDYYPPPCALEKIVNSTITACDPLDGRTDGVVARSDLCKLNFNLTDIIGESYYCAAETATSLGYGFGRRDLSRRADGSTTTVLPEQNGTVTAQDVEVAQKVYDGLFNSDGERAYLSFQIASSLDDADTAYDNSTDQYVLNFPATGGEWVAKWIELLDIDTLPNLDNVTYDTLVQWMDQGLVRYYDSLQTTLPDLTPFKQNGGKLIHFHGESDPSVPSPSSIHYRQSVLKAMYPSLATLDAEEELNEWYQFYLVPGAAHCSTNSLQPGPYPEDLVNQIIDWVENGNNPVGLNATVSSGDYAGETQFLCKWPLRPLWTNTTSFDCVHDSASLESWTYEFPAFKQAVY